MEIREAQQKKQAAIEAIIQILMTLEQETEGKITALDMNRLGFRNGKSIIRIDIRLEV